MGGRCKKTIIMEQRYEENRESQVPPKRYGADLFEERLSEEIIEIVEAHHKALTLLQKQRGNYDQSYFNRNWSPNQMNCNLKGILSEKFPLNIKNGSYGRFYFLKPGEYIIYFKKLTNEFWPSNIQTINSQKILNQISIEGTERLPIVFIGYRINSTWDGFDSLNAVYISNDNIVWNSDLMAAAAGRSVKQLDAFSENQEEILEVEVTIKGNHNKKTG